MKDLSKAEIIDLMNKFLISVPILSKGIDRKNEFLKQKVNLINYLRSPKAKNFIAMNLNNEEEKVVKNLIKKHNPNVKCIFSYWT